MRDGFAYVKLPSSSLNEKLLKLEQGAIRFFRQPQEIKERNKFNPDTLQGYIDKRKEGKKLELVEQITFPPVKPIGLFTEYKTELEEINESYCFKIVKPLVKAIFHRILQRYEFSAEKINDFFAETTDEMFFLMSVLFYPYSHSSLQQTSSPTEYIIQPDHIDESLLTILWVTLEGLQVWLEDAESSSKEGNDGRSGAWHNVGPKAGYVAVNIGKAMSLILSGKCNGVRHRVISPKKDRLSIGVFCNPLATYKLRDIIENKLLFGGSYAEYIKDYFSK